MRLLTIAKIDNYIRPLDYMMFLIVWCSHHQKLFSYIKLFKKKINQL